MKTKKPRTGIFASALTITLLLVSACQSPISTGAANSSARAIVAPPATGVWSSGQYRNLFVENGQTAANVSAAVQSFYNQVMNPAIGTSAGQLTYVSAGKDSSGNALGYIWSADSNDVRTEGMSYGMMISLQMNDQATFNALWNWAHTYMLNTNGIGQHDNGYFAWDCNTNGSHIDNGPAPDGDTWFAAALFMAGNRWGNGSGIYNYAASANSILDEMVAHQAINGLASSNTGDSNEIDPTANLVVFATNGSSATYTDPSYNTPAFYELFARWATSTYYNPATFWTQVAVNSRALLQSCLNSTTFLGPDYCSFTGVATGGNHANFEYDAWRIMQNLSLDYYWWHSAAAAWEPAAVAGLQNFFNGVGISSYGNLYQLNGSPVSGASESNSPGLVGMNAEGGLISTNSSVSSAFVTALWNKAPTLGTYRYYDNMLQLLGLLNCSGQFQIWGRGTGATATDPTSTSTSTTTTTTTGSSPTGTSTAADTGTVAATSYTASSGITTTTSTINGTATSVIQFASGSAYAAFGPFNFTASSISMSVNANLPSSGSLKVFLDSPTGSQVATIYPNGNGAWGTASNTFYPVPSGSHTIYISMTTTNALLNSFDITGAALTTGTTTTPPPTTDPTPPATPPPASTPASPYTQFAATSYNTSSGSVSAISGDGTTVVNLGTAGSYIVFNNVDFGTTGPNSVSFRVSSSHSGATINVYVDSPTGTNFGTVYPATGSSFGSASNTCYPHPTGVHTLYVKVSQPMAINWIQFQ